MENTTPTTGPIRFGVFELDVRAGELRKNGSHIKMQEQAFQILRSLQERSVEIITREEEYPIRSSITPAPETVSWKPLLKGKLYVPNGEITVGDKHYNWYNFFGGSDHAAENLWTTRTETGILNAIRCACSIW